jgi:tyrosinase
VAKVEDLIDNARLGYANHPQEPVQECPTTRAVAVAAAQGAKPRAAAKTTPITLGAEPVRVPLDPLPEGAGLEAVDLPNHVRSLAPGRRLYLVVKNLRAQTQPGVLYHLYLELPSDAARGQMAAHHVGVVNFFHAVGHGGHEHAAAAKKGTERFLRFDITDLAKKLQAQGLLKQKPILTIAPAGKPAAEAKPVIGEITIIER